jgi:hypothetical protein
MNRLSPSTVTPCIDGSSPLYATIYLQHAVLVITLVFKVVDRENGDRVSLGDALSCGGVAREQMSVTCARG